jgi:hypothetical protein
MYETVEVHGVVIGVGETDPEFPGMHKMLCNTLMEGDDDEARGAESRENAELIAGALNLVAEALVGEGST